MTDNELFAYFPLLETKRLILDEYQTNHAQDVFNILSQKEVSYHEIRDPFTKIEEAQNYVQARLFQSKEKAEGVFWAIRLKNSEKIIGDIGYSPYLPFISEVGFKLHPDYWNQGILSEALQIVIHFLFTETDTRRIEGLTRPANLAAIRVLEKNGFKKEGTLRESQFFNEQAFDMNLYAMLKSEYKH